MNRLYDLEDREKVPKYIKYKNNSKEKSNLVNSKKEKDYEYYVCDFCKEEIKITPKKAEMTGGLVTIPQSLTRRSKINLALCNKCLNPVLELFSEEREKKGEKRKNGNNITR